MYISSKKETGGKLLLYMELQNLGYFLLHSKNKGVTTEYLKNVALNNIFTILIKNVRLYPGELTTNNSKVIRKELEICFRRNGCKSLGFDSYVNPDINWMKHVIFTFNPNSYILAKSNYIEYKRLSIYNWYL